jgi:hypothetical protein
VHHLLRESLEGRGRGNQILTIVGEEDSKIPQATGQIGIPLVIGMSKIKMEIDSDMTAGEIRQTATGTLVGRGVTNRLTTGLNQDLTLCIGYQIYVY